MEPIKVSASEARVLSEEPANAPTLDIRTEPGIELDWSEKLQSVENTFRKGQLLAACQLALQLEEFAADTFGKDDYRVADLIVWSVELNEMLGPHPDSVNRLFRALAVYRKNEIFYELEGHYDLAKAKAMDLMALVLIKSLHSGKTEIDELLNESSGWLQRALYLRHTFQLYESEQERQFELARSSHTIATVWYLQGDYGRAYSLLKQATLDLQRFATATEEKLLFADASELLAQIGIELESDIPKLASEWAKASLTARRQLLDEEHFQIGQAKVTLARAKNVIGFDIESEALFESGLSALQVALSTAHPSVALAKAAYARHLTTSQVFVNGSSFGAASLQGFERSEALITDAQSALKLMPEINLLGRVCLLEAFALTQLGYHQADPSGKRLDRAEVALDQAIETAEMSLRPSHPVIAKLYILLGQLYILKGGEFEGAIRVEQAVERIIQAIGPKSRLSGLLVNHTISLLDSLGYDDRAQIWKERLDELNNQ